MRIEEIESWLSNRGLDENANAIEAGAQVAQAREIVRFLLGERRRLLLGSEFGGRFFTKLASLTPRSDGEWFDVNRGHRITCCDCGLVHDLRFRVTQSKPGTARLEMCATRRPRVTKKLRRLKEREWFRSVLDLLGKKGER